MKFKITFKTPDAFQNLMKECEEQARQDWEDLDDEAALAVVDGGEYTAEEWIRERAHELADAVNKIAAPYVRFGEYITVEFDTETKQAGLILNTR